MYVWRLLVVVVIVEAIIVPTSMMISHKGWSIWWCPLFALPVGYGLGRVFAPWVLGIRRSHNG